MKFKFWKKRKTEAPAPITGELSESQKKYLIKEYESYLDSCRDSKRYSNQKLDYLLVGLSASGIVLLLGMAKDFKDKITSNREIFIISIVCFVLCIILNFIKPWPTPKVSATKISIPSGDYTFHVFLPGYPSSEVKWR